MKYIIRNLYLKYDQYTEFKRENRGFIHRASAINTNKLKRYTEGVARIGFVGPDWAGDAQAGDGFAMLTPVVCKFRH